MKYDKIIIAGGTGYLGVLLSNYFLPVTRELVVLCRKIPSQKLPLTYVLWNGEDAGPWTETMENADLLINLCGRNVNCRYTAANKKQIIESRTRPTHALGQAVQQLVQPPKCWINASSATWYRSAHDRPQSEADGEEGYGFSIDVVNAWERAFFEYRLPHTRQIALRTGIVLGRSDGAFPRMLNLVKCGLGGHQGNGRQMMSWIHEHDLARIVDWLGAGNGTGIYNATAPGPVSNRDFMKTLRHTYGISVGLNAPQWLLEFGAAIIGTETELLLKSRWVLPERLQQQGFRFHYATAGDTIDDLLSLRC